MKFIKQLIFKLFLEGKYTSNKAAADIIRRFVNGPVIPGEWDDFETINEDNPEADTAIKLIWFLASKYPAQGPNEYCDKRALPFILKIADTLENGEFRNIDPIEIKTCLKNKKLSERFKGIIGIKDD